MQRPLDRSHLARFGVFVVIAALGTVTAVLPMPLPAGAAEPGAESSAESPDAAPKAANEAPEAQPDEAAPVDPFAVPEGTPEELLEYLKDLRQQRPAAMDYQSMMAFQQKMNTAMVTAADRILAAEPTAEQANTAVRAKMIALSMLQRLGDEAASERLAKVPEELEAAGMPELAREAEGFLLGHRLRHAMQAEPEEMKQLVGEVKAFLGQQPARSEAHLAIMAAQVAEFSGNSELAAATYEAFGQLLAKSDDETVARLGTKMEGAARRMNLVGNELEISGATLEGEPLDWSQYEGKAVLVVFWATWCGPCRAEIPHLREAYKMYHDRGFEIVAINCDDQRQPVDEFLAANPVPWTVLFSDDPEARGMDNPMAQKFGVMAIPATIFVGKSGKVISLQARGPALFELLAEQLGPPEEESAEESSPENAEKSEAAEATN